jgi:CspA family cold shock protein
MNFKDTWVTDEAGERFVFTVEMQRRLEEAGLPVDPAYLDRLADIPRPTAVRQTAAPSPSERPAIGRSEGDNGFPEPESIQIDPETGKYIGRMKWYNDSRGYGFIARGGGEDIFFHKTAVIGDPAALAEGQWILYDVEEKKKGPEATEVEPYEGNLIN